MVCLATTQRLCYTKPVVGRTMVCATQKGGGSDVVVHISKTFHSAVQTGASKGAAFGVGGNFRKLGTARGFYKLKKGFFTVACAFHSTQAIAETQKGQLHGIARVGQGKTTATFFIFLNCPFN